MSKINKELIFEMKGAAKMQKLISQSRIVIGDLLLCAMIVFLFLFKRRPWNELLDAIDFSFSGGGK